MNSVRVLVLDADSSAGLAATQALGARGREVHVAVRNSGSLIESSRWSHTLHKQPASLPTDLAISWLMELDDRFQFDLIIPSTESSLLWLRALPEGNAIRNKAVLAQNTSIDTALNKSSVHELAANLGIPVPKCRVLTQGSEVDAADAFPVVLKPIRSKVIIGERLHSLSVAIARDAKARDLFLQKTLPHTDVQEQSWVEGRGVGVEVLYDRGKLAWHFVHQRMHEWPLTGGASSLRRAAPDNPILVEHSRRLLDALNWHGVAMVEWRCTSAGNFHLIEVNPRLWGSLPLTIAAGVNMAEGLLALSLGSKLPEAQAWNVGLTARNLSKDFSWTITNARADHHDPLLLTERSLSTLTGWCRVLTGREVWDGWSIKDPHVGMRELRLLISRTSHIAFALLRKAWYSRIVRARHLRLLREVRSGQRAIKNILFLCYGNICRSPFAAMAATKLLQTGIQVESAGFHQKAGRESPYGVSQVAHTLGIDLIDFRSKMLTDAQVSAADLIIVMDLSNLDALTSKFPEAGKRTILLGLYDSPAASVEIADPYDLSIEQTEEVLRKILRSVERLCRDLNLDRTNAIAARSTIFES